MEFRDVDRRTVVQQVAEQLRDAVVDAVNRSIQLPAEASLSRAMTVSRPTLREALRILEAEGLVSRDSRTSALRPDARAPAMSRPLRSALTVLTRTERITLAEVVDLRATIEERAAYRAAEVATPADLQRLEAALAEVREAAAAGGDVDGASFLFHVELMRASHNEAFHLVMLAAREAAADLLEQAAARARGRRAGERDPADSPLPADDSGQFTLQRDTLLFDAIREHRGADAGALLRSSMEVFYSPLMEQPEVESGDEN
jgi:GntR family transcriptional repressor for pyruvate dehydrogenase complex